MVFVGRAGWSRGAFCRQAADELLEDFVALDEPDELDEPLPESELDDPESDDPEVLEDDFALDELELLPDDELRLSLR